MKLLIGILTFGLIGLFIIVLTKDARIVVLEAKVIEIENAMSNDLVRINGNVNDLRNLSGTIDQFHSDALKQEMGKRKFDKLVKEWDAKYNPKN